MASASADCRHGKEALELELYESYKECEQHLNQLMEDFSLETQKARNLLSQMKAEIMDAHTNISIREKNVLQMEASIRNHIDAKSKLQEQLNAAVQGENAGIVKQQLLQEKLDTEKSKNEALEKRKEEMSRHIVDLEKKVSELSLINQKLSKDKATLLQAQITGGNV